MDIARIPVWFCRGLNRRAKGMDYKAPANLFNLVHFQIPLEKGLAYPVNST